MWQSWAPALGRRGACSGPSLEHCLPAALETYQGARGHGYLDSSNPMKLPHLNELRAQAPEMAAGVFPLRCSPKYSRKRERLSLLPSFPTPLQAGMGTRPVLPALLPSYSCGLSSCDRDHMRPKTLKY